MRPALRPVLRSLVATNHSFKEGARVSAEIANRVTALLYENARQTQDGYLLAHLQKVFAPIGPRSRWVALGNIEAQRNDQIGGLVFFDPVETDPFQIPERRFEGDDGPISGVRVLVLGGLRLRPA